MASKKDCLQIAQAKFPALPEDDLITAMVKVKQMRSKSLDADRTGATTDEIKAYFAAEEALAVKELRNQLQSERILLEQTHYVTNTFASNPYEGIMAILGGSNRVKAGARLNIDAAQKGAEARNTGAFHADLLNADENLVKMLDSGEFDQPLFHALFELNTHGRLETEFSEPVQYAAMVIRKHLNKTREEANAAGASIGSLDGYIMPQTHDIMRMDKVGADAWTEFIADKLDFEKTFNADGGIRSSFEAEIGAHKTAIADIQQELDSLLKTGEGRRGAAGELGKAEFDTAMVLREERKTIKQNMDIYKENLADIDSELKALKTQGDADSLTRVDALNKERLLIADEHARAKDGLKEKQAQYNRLLTDKNGKKKKVGGMSADDVERISGLRWDKANFEKTLAVLDRSIKEIRDAASPDDYNNILKNIYTYFVKGQHLRHVDETHVSFKNNGSKLGKTAKRLSHERVLHFKDADASFEYNKSFGSGNVLTTVIDNIRHSTRTTELMKGLGSDAELNFQTLLNNVDSFSMKNNVDKILTKSQRARLTNVYKELDGSINIPENHTIATVFSVIRKIQNMSKLGGVLLSSISDTAFYAMEMSYHGKSFVGNLFGAFYSIPKHLRATPETKALVESMGITLDYIRAFTANGRFYDNYGAKMSKLEHRFFRATGLPQWTNALRIGAALQMSNILATSKRLQFGELSPELQRIYSLYGINAKEWNVIRHMKEVSVAGDKRKFLQPDAVKNVSDSVMAKYLTDHDMKVSPAAIMEARMEIRDKLQNYFADRNGFAVLEPDARVRGTIKMGTQSGTWVGEGVRSAMQFKSFLFAVMQKVWGRSFYGRGSNSVLEALKNTHGEMGDIAKTLIATTVLGYVTLSLRALTSGMSPPDIGDPKTWAASVAQGGSFGMLEGFLFGDNRSGRGGSFLATLAGPTGGSIERAFDIFGKMKEGDSFVAGSYAWAKNHLPFGNLFYLKTPLNLIVHNGVLELFSEGYNKRAVRRAEKKGQTYFIDPLTLYGGV